MLKRPSQKASTPPCVAVIDLDEVPRDVVENGYSTQVDLYGLVSMLVLFGTTVALMVHVFYLWEDQGWNTLILYVPTIPTFGDERQQQLKGLLDQAQLRDDAYRRFYVWRCEPRILK